MRMEGILEALSESQDDGEGTTMTQVSRPPPFLPSELINVISGNLIESQDVRTCAMLNRTCRDVHYGTLPTLWNTLICQTRVGLKAFVESKEWQYLISTKGFQYTRFFVLEVHGASAFVVMTAPKTFESGEMQEVMKSVHAVMVTDSTSWPRHSEPDVTDVSTRIKDGRFLGIRLTNKYIYASSDFYNLLNALGQGNYLVLHIFPSAGSPSAGSASSSNAFPFKTVHLGPVAHIGCITVNMYHEPEEVGEYRAMTLQVITEMLGLVAYSRELLDSIAIRAKDEKSHEATTVDVIGVDEEMAVMCIYAFTTALRIVPELATISFQIQMDIPAFSTALARKILSSLKNVYYKAILSAGRVRAGNVKLSRVPGEESITIGFCNCPGSGAEEDPVLSVIATDDQGRIARKGDLNTWLNESVGLREN